MVSTLLKILKWNADTYVTCSSLTPFLQGRPKLYVRRDDKIIAIENNRESASFDEWTNRELNPVNHDGETKLIAWDLQSGKHPTKGEAWEAIKINVINYRP